MIDHRDQIRIVQETVAGKEITFAHVMGGPAPIIYQKLGLNPQVDYRSSAIGIMNMTPPESAVIASDIAVKSGNVYLGFADRFTGTLIITGEISEVMSALTEVVNYFRDSLGYLHLLDYPLQPILRLLIQVSQVCPQLSRQEQAVVLNWLMLSQILPAHPSPPANGTGFLWQFQVRNGIIAHSNVLNFHSHASFTSVLL